MGAPSPEQKKFQSKVNFTVVGMSSPSEKVPLNPSSEQKKIPIRLKKFQHDLALKFGSWNSKSKLTIFPAPFGKGGSSKPMGSPSTEQKQFPI